MASLFYLKNLDIILLVSLLLIVVILSLTYYFSINDLKREINKKDKIQIKEPIQVTWNNNLQKAVISIELGSNSILTLLLNKEELSTLSHDIANLNTLLNNKLKADSVDILKGKKGDMKKLKDSDNITINAKYYKKLRSEYNSLKKENMILKKRFK